MRGFHANGASATVGVVNSQSATEAPFYHAVVVPEMVNQFVPSLTNEVRPAPAAVPAGVTNVVAPLMVFGDVGVIVTVPAAVLTTVNRRPGVRAEMSGTVTVFAEVLV